jgi:hypothetical protein
MTMTASIGEPNSAPTSGIISSGRPPMGRVMRAVIRKELQQNWVNLALVICLEFIIVCTAEWFRSGWLFDTSHEFPNILQYSAVRSAITLGCAVAGLLLGVLQPLADRNFDLWAFLTHRPVPRWWLYAGRASAGVILYVAAAGLPVGFALAMAPTHWGGRFFIVDYLLPPIADWTAGLVYYFAGLLIMERQARWYGSRIVPVFAVIAVSLCVTMVGSFWMAMTICAGMIALYVVVSMGSAISHGYSLRTPRWAHAALILAIFASYASLFFVVAGFPFARIADAREWLVTGNVEHNATWNSSLWTPQRGYQQRSYHLLADGTLAIFNGHFRLVLDERKQVGFQLTEHAWTDFDGHPIADPTVYWGDLNYQPNLIGLGVTVPEETVGYRDFGRRVQQFSHDDGTTHYQTTWYWVPERGLAYVYREPRMMADPESWKIPSEFLGTIGVDGFHSPGKSATPFESPVWSGAMFITPHTLYFHPGGTLEIRPLLSLPSDEKILQLGYERERLTEQERLTMKGSAGDEDYKPIDDSNIVVRTNHRMLVLAPANPQRAEWHAPPGTVLVALPLPAALANGRLEVSHFPTVGRWVVESNPDQLDAAKPHVSSTFYFYNERGELLDKKEVANVRQITQEPELMLLPRGVRKMHKLEVQSGLLAATMNPVLAAASPWIFGEGNEAMKAEMRLEVAGLGRSWRFWVSVWSVLVLCGVMSWRLASAYALPRGRWLWMVVSLIFGPAVVLTFVATHRLPTWVRCATCRRFRLRGGERCGKCGATWPKAEPTGTEIWAADNGATAK